MAGERESLSRRRCILAEAERSVASTATSAEKRENGWHKQHTYAANANEKGKGEEAPGRALRHGREQLNGAVNKGGEAGGGIFCHGCSHTTTCSDTGTW